MFVQIIRGPIDDATAARALADDWLDRLAPGADGWEWTTAGVTEDGTLVVVGAFSTPEQAQRNSDRPEQGEWWSRFESVFTGPVAFRNCSEVTTVRGGASPSAGFVQVIEARTSAMDRVRSLGDEIEQRMADARPDLLGLLVAYHDDEPGGFTQIVYFTDEESARTGEQAGFTGEAAEKLDELMSLITDVKYYDLAKPWLDWPR